jgi:O-antigen/teichoic acid export membrane protein
MPSALNSAGSARGGLRRGAAGTILLRVISAGLGFAASIVLARRLGMAGYGQYTFALSGVLLLGVLGLAGLDRLLVRQVAVCRTQGQWGAAGGLLRWAMGGGLLAGCVLAGLAAALGAIVTLYRPGLFGLALPSSGISWVWLLVPLLVLMRLPQAALRGLNFIIRSQIPETIIQPFLLIVGIITVSGMDGGHLTAEQALVIYAAATAAAVMAALLFLRFSLPAEIKEAPPVYLSRVWIAAALPLLLVSGLDILNSQMDLLMLGLLAGAKAVAFYSAADRGAGLIAFPVLAATASLTPAFAGLHAAGDRGRLQVLVTKSAQGMLLGATGIALCLIVGRIWYLRLFGPGFVPAQNVLLILSAGQWVNAAAGAVASLLLMTGYARDVALGLGLSVGVNFLLNLVLIPRWGAAGAAVAVSVSTVLWNVVLAGFVRRRLGLFSTAFGAGRQIGRSH